jgi:hypothetical protein
LIDPAARAKLAAAEALLRESRVSVHRAQEIVPSLEDAFIARLRSADRSARD